MRKKLNQCHIADNFYYIDTVSACNLKCPSCPNGNCNTAGRTHIMSFDTFKAILEKIRCENPQKNVFLYLFNWGEPLLNRNIASFVDHAKKMGFGVGLSSNFNLKSDIAAILNAEPDFIRISLSGLNQKSYGFYHYPGNIEEVKKNIKTLSAEMAKNNRKTIVEVCFHIYRDNFLTDFEEVLKLCGDESFVFTPVVAAVMPLEKALKTIISPEELSHTENELVDRLIIKPYEISGMSRDIPEKRECIYQSHRTAIDADGSVFLCCASFEKEQKIHDNFLEASAGNLTNIKMHHPMCGLCKKHHMDLAYSGALHNDMISIADKAEANGLREYCDIINSPIPITWMEQELDVQTACDKGIEYIRDHRLKEAVSLFSLIVKEYDNHADAQYHLARAYNFSGDHNSATECCLKALELCPESQVYTKMLKTIGLKKGEN